jgi:acetyl esterase/lipase
MELSPLQLVPVLVPKLPLLTREAIRHVLRLSENSKYLDLSSHLTVTILRTFLEPSVLRSVTETQQLTLQDPGIKGRIWVSRFSAPLPPEPDVREALVSAIDGLAGPELKNSHLPVPDLLPVEAEWTGYRKDAGSDASPPAISESEKYNELMKECTSNTTVLYFHGGAFYLLDPCTYRATTKKLAKLTGGRLFVVRYRLAPSNPFPAALLDALVAYLTLLYPPPDAYHEPVPPAEIVFAGDRFVAQLPR